ncbi:glycosyltransferase-like protein [Selaginella moellendorffii]|uniref:Glycosyltransferase-like protein n=1 Tax=Selaginella moellendorffii TaxID=88036 RepID=D8R2R0_SELML|nr:glycosyltransferase-like protein [Selaginella moellendorffii]
MIVLLVLAYGVLLLYAVTVHLTVRHYVNFNSRTRLHTIKQDVDRDFGATNLTNIVFGISSNAAMWDSRKELVRAWWRPEDRMRGFVWLDEAVNSTLPDQDTLPEIKVSSDTSKFRYTYGRSPSNGRHHIRIARIVSEMFRLGLGDVRWFVMGDDDTVFVPGNLAKVLAKYDHRQPYYIGSISESHFQNVDGFSTNMAYGGAGFAISYALAEELDEVLDDCLERYHGLYSADARIHACVAELGVPLTVERGFHQFDVLDDASGLLSSHPLTPLVSLHHIELLDPFFPRMGRIESVKHLIGSAHGVDPMGLLQQSFCYDPDRNWTIKVSWGFVVQIHQGEVPEKDLELPVRTFSGWHRDRDRVGIAFTTRENPVDLCDRPVNFYLTWSTGLEGGKSSSSYAREERTRWKCLRTEKDLSMVKTIRVVKDITPDPWLLEVKLTLLFNPE